MSKNVPLRCLLKSFKNLKKARKRDLLFRSDLLLYEFPAEEKFCQSFSGLFIELQLLGFDEKVSNHQMKAKDLFFFG